MKNRYQDGLFYWTKHAQEKLRQYNLSANRIKRVIRHASRVEAGIAPETWASMQVAGSQKHPYEIWTMYVIEKSRLRQGFGGQAKATTQLSSLRKRGSETLSPRKQEILISMGMTAQNFRPKTIKIISAWKYPGKTNPGDPIPIPPDIFEELTKELSLS